MKNKSKTQPAQTTQMTQTRRGFMKAAAALTAATALSPALLQGAGKRRGLRKAIMYATIGIEGSVMEKFRELKAAGFEGVEPMSHMDQAEVLKALEATGLKAASVCGEIHWKKPLSDPDPTVRAEGLEGLKRTLRDAKAYGATCILLVPGKVIEGVTYEDCFQRSIAEIKKALPLAEQLGVKIAIENVGNNFITTPEQAVSYLDAINSPLVGWYFDIGNIYRYGLPETWIPILGKRIVRLHFKENSPSKQTKARFLEGQNNWPAIMKAVDAIGYTDWAITEQPKEQTQDAASLKDFATRLEKVLEA